MIGGLASSSIGEGEHQGEDEAGRRASAWLQVGALVVGALIAGAAMAAASTVGADEAPRAGLVVQFGDGSVREYCVDLGGAARTGEELLRLSGLAVVADSGGGTRVCAIGGEGCPRDDCWCRCRVPGPGCVYWAYYTLADDRWHFSTVGAASRTVRDGDVDGWAWGPGSVSAGIEPPARTFDQLCAAAEPTAASSPAPAVVSPTIVPATAVLTTPTAPTPTAIRTSLARQPTASPSSAPTLRLTRTPRPTPTPRPTLAPRRQQKSHPTPSPRPAGGSSAVATAARAPTALAMPRATGAPDRWSAAAATVAAPTKVPAAIVGPPGAGDRIGSAGATPHATATLARVQRVAKPDLHPPPAPGVPSRIGSAAGYLLFGVVMAGLAGVMVWLRKGQ